MSISMLDDAKALLNYSEESVEPTRREALKWTVGLSLGAGYSLAAGPAVAQTALKTDTKGLSVGEVTIDVDGFKLPAYRAMPESGKNLPIVLVVSEIFGVHEYIADVCRRFAKLGYLAIAPELFVRQGDPSDYAEVAKLISEVVSKVPDAQVMRDLDACREWGEE